MLLVIDNYDSFTYNLVQLLGALGQTVEVVRNDEIAAADIGRRGPTHLVISPGPRTPDQAGISLEAIGRYAGTIPILGVCLGHQAIGQAFGGKVVRARQLMHGKTSPIFHDGRGLFAGLPSPFEATRYHSLLVDPTSLPECLEVTARTAGGEDGEDGDIMGLRHKTLAVEGVQFHPESFLTTVGKDLLRNFLQPGAPVTAAAPTATPPSAIPPAFGAREALARLAERQDLTADEMTQLVGWIMDGGATPAQVGGLLVGLRMKGETVGEIVGAARAMRARMLPVPFTSAGPILDTCGTGGDGSRSVNISTLASFIVAGCGVVVAKHGNRAQSSRSGSHDVIEELGLDAGPAPEVSVRCLAEAKLAFLFAQVHHAATRHVNGPRREIGLRTLFNLLGPLTNPCGARFHVNGIFSADRCEPLARAHGLLGSERALVVHGAGGLDEIAPAGATRVAELRDGEVRVYEITPADFGLPATDPGELLGGEPAFNARVILETLEGGGRGAVRNAALMAAAAALYVVGEAPALRDGVARAAEALDGGAARAVLEKLRALAPRKPPASAP